MLAALVGTLIQVPGMFEIPLVIGVLALGLGAGPATALLLTLPSTGLITLALTRKAYGWRIPASLLGSTFAFAIGASVLVEAL